MPHASGLILVTGATGFTGGHLARTLKRRGHRVRALVRDIEKARDLDREGIELVEGDIRSPDDVMRAACDVERIYHIAAVFRTAGHPDSYYHEVNVRGTENVLKAAHKNNVHRIIHCSTVGVHGNVSMIPSDETAPYNPGDIYQVTKLEGEMRAQEAIARGAPVVIFRPTGIYGPGDLRFLKLFRTIHSRRFRMFGDGRTFYHFTYIDDLIQGIILCGEHPNAVGQTYILGGDEYITLNDMVATIAQAVGVPPPRGHLPLWPLRIGATVCETLCRPLGIDPPLHHRRIDFFVKNRAFTSAKAKQELGYAPAVSFAEGARRTAAWYFQHSYLTSRDGTPVAATEKAGT